MHFDHFIQQACQNQNLVWRKYRRASKRRVLERIRLLGLGGYREYLSYLAADPIERQRLPNLLHATVSRFFREYDCWRFLIRSVLPRLMGECSGKVLKVFCAGSCGGEEPYSLALCWKEYMRPEFPDVSIEILAHELDQNGLLRSQEALYRPKTLREVPTALKEKWFVNKGRLLELKPEIQRMVKFECKDLLSAPWPTGQHLILCRYLFFTYFTGKRLDDVVKRLWHALEPEGALMVGKKESFPVGGLRLFSPWQPSDDFFVKIVPPSSV